ncbi:MAG: DCC1-like thiol-disulfide oxidoreductase family protein, partial [Saprospiraceae bacterium]
MLRPADALPRAKAQQPSKIIFYDGVCPMCNTWVKRIIRWDRKKVFHFAALESETAQKLLTPLLPGYLAEDT